MLRQSRRECELSPVPGDRTSALTQERHRFDFKHVLAQINPGTREATYHKDTIVFTQGDASDSVFFIHDGKAKVTIQSNHGKEAVVALLGPGQFCGEACLAGQRLRVATFRTMTKCILTRLNKLDITRLLEVQPEFSALFISHLLNRNIRIEEDIVDHLFNSTEKRLARTLLLLTTFGKEVGPKPVTPRINQETLAEMIGATRSRVNVFMNKFRKLGYIHYNKDHLEVNVSLLKSVLLDQS
jgi:CRP/FNR family transcriptional regulator, cyclic AMP receptor protein